MRGIHSNKSEIRQEVFTEVAKMAFDGGDFSRMEELPYKLVPGEISNYYDNIFYIICCYDELFIIKNN